MKLTKKIDWYHQVLNESIVMDFLQDSDEFSDLRRNLSCLFDVGDSSDPSAQKLFKLLEEHQTAELIKSQFPRLETNRGGGFRTDDEAGALRPKQGDISGEENRFVIVVKKITETDTNSKPNSSQ